MDFRSLNKNKSAIKPIGLLIAGILVVALSVCASGCASAGRSGSGYGKNDRIITSKSKKYQSLSTLCNKYGLIWEGNVFSRIISLKKDGIVIKMYPGSSLVLYNGNVHDLSLPVEVSQGLVMVPGSFLELLRGEREEKPIYKIPEIKKSASLIKKIVIDAGHGGNDPGAVRGSIIEKNINLDIARRLKKELQDKGFEVVLTRDEDVFHPLGRRPEIANEEKADFFVSIHSNAAESASAKGFEAYYLSPDYDDFSKAVQIRENAAAKFEDNKYAYDQDLNATLWDMMLTENRIESMEMAYAISGELKRFLKLNTRYIKGAMFYVLKGARMPAILLEVGYLSNPTEAAQLNNTYYRQMLAEAIASGIMNYKNNYEKNNGFSR